MPTNLEIQMARALLVLIQATYMKDVSADAYLHVDLDLINWVAEQEGDRAE